VIERAVAGGRVGRILEQLNIAGLAVDDVEAHAGDLREEIGAGARDAQVEQILDERAGAVSADVISARPLTDEVKASLEAALRQVSQKKVRLNFKTDETLLGGIVTRIGSTIYDGSVRNQLTRLGEELAG